MGDELDLQSLWSLLGKKIGTLGIGDSSTKTAQGSMDGAKWLKNNKTVQGIGKDVASGATMGGGGAAPVVGGRQAPAPRGEAGQADTEENSHQPSVFKESDENKVKSMRSWMLSGTYANGLTFAALIHGTLEKQNLRQLAQTAKKAKLKEHAKMLNTGERTYQLWDAYEDKITTDFLKEVTSMLFDSEAWRLIRETTEWDQLKAFKLPSRAGGLCYQLIRVRHRKTPFKTFLSI